MLPLNRSLTKPLKCNERLPMCPPTVLPRCSRCPQRNMTQQSRQAEAPCVQESHRLCGQARSLLKLLMISGTSPCRGRGSRAYSLKSVRGCSFISNSKAFLHLIIKQESRADTAFGPKCLGCLLDFLWRGSGGASFVLLFGGFAFNCEFTQDRQPLNESRVRHAWIRSI
jgi:hypothetical protein